MPSKSNESPPRRSVQSVGVMVVLLLSVALLSVIVTRQGKRNSTERPAGAISLEGTTAQAFYTDTCAPCHELATAGKDVNIPPDLRYAGSRVQYEWLVDFLLDLNREPVRWQSQGVRSVLVMPPYEMPPATADAVAGYLMSKKDGTLIPPSGIDWDASASAQVAAEGRQLYDEYQCAGCHIVVGEGLEIGPKLDGVGTKLQPDFMYRWLLDPQKIVPGTAMPNKDLWDEEAQALVQYLRTLTPQSD